MAFFRIVPNLTIMAPKDFKELEDMMTFAVNLKAPVVIRYPRGGEAERKFRSHSYIYLKRAETLTIGKDVTIVAIGNQVSKAMEVCMRLKKYGISAEVINARFIKPIDYNMFNNINVPIFVYEESTIIGSLGSYLKSISNKNITIFGIKDKFIPQGDRNIILEKLGLDVDTIVEKIDKKAEKGRK